MNQSFKCELIIGGQKLSHTIHASCIKMSQRNSDNNPDKNSASGDGWMFLNSISSLTQGPNAKRAHQDAYRKALDEQIQQRKWIQQQEREKYERSTRNVYIKHFSRN